MSNGPPPARCFLVGLIALGTAVGVQGTETAGRATKRQGEASAPTQYDPPARVKTGHELVRYYLDQARDALTRRRRCREAEAKRSSLVRRAAFRSITSMLKESEFRMWVRGECESAGGSGDLTEWALRLPDAFIFALSGSNRPVQEFRNRQESEAPSWVDSLGADSPACQESVTTCVSASSDGGPDCYLRLASQPPCEGTAAGTFYSWLGDGSHRGHRLLAALAASRVPGAKYRFPDAPMSVDWSSWHDPVLDPLFDEYQGFLGELRRSAYEAPPEAEWPKPLGATGLAVADDCNLVTWEDRSGTKPVEFQRITCSAINRSDRSVVASCQALVYDADGSPVSTESSESLRVPALGRGILKADLYGLPEERIGYVEFSCD